MTQDLHFVTAISGQTTKGMFLRTRPLTELIAEADFVSTLFFSITGRKPRKAEAKILNALLVAAFDHGVYPSSGFVPRVVAATGNDILTCMASSLLALGPYHGGAVTGAMQVLHRIQHDGTDKELACERLIDEFRLENRRIPGFGHPEYKTVDPRAKVLFEVARKADIDIEYLNLARQLEHSLEQKLNKPLVLNIDGAMAAVLLTLGIAPEAGNGIFGLARVAGSIAHSLEELQSGTWVRRLPETAVEFAPKNG